MKKTPQLSFGFNGLPLEHVELPLLDCNSINFPKLELYADYIAHAWLRAYTYAVIGHKVTLKTSAPVVFFLQILKKLGVEDHPKIFIEFTCSLPSELAIQQLNH